MARYNTAARPNTASIPPPCRRHPANQTPDQRPRFIERWLTASSQTAPFSSPGGNNRFGPESGRFNRLSDTAPGNGRTKPHLRRSRPSRRRWTARCCPRNWSSGRILNKFPWSVGAPRTRAGRRRHRWLGHGSRRKCTSLVPLLRRMTSSAAAPKVVLILRGLARAVCWSTWFDFWR